MGMSIGLLSVIILFLVIFHAGALTAYYFHKVKQQRAGTGADGGSRLDARGKKILHWVMVLLLPVSWILSIVATASCSFLTVLVSNPLNPREDLEWGIGFSRMFLPLELASTFGQDGGCESLDTLTGNVSLSPANSAAKSFAIFNTILTTIAFIGSIALTFKLTMAERRDFCYLMMRICMYISMFCCIFTFYLREDEACDVFVCSLGPQGIMQVVNVILILVIVVILFLTDAGKIPYYRGCLISAQEVYDRKVEKGQRDPEFPARA